jgi:hypothetical protein
MRCPRSGCHGCLCWNYEDWYCISCGWHHNPPDQPAAPTMDPARWKSVLCSICHSVPAIQRTELCPACTKARHQRQGYASHKKKVAQDNA